MNMQPVAPKKKRSMRGVGILAACTAVGLGLFTEAAHAQQYPAGSGPDGVLRLVAEKLTRLWGQPVVVENRPGGNGFIALEAAKKAPADGHTFVQADEGHLVLAPHLYKRVPYDFKDFDPVGTLFRGRFFVVVPAGSPWKDMEDLIAAARAKPGDITYV